MGFSTEVMADRYIRQDGKCACCDKKLEISNHDQGEKGAWHAHHIDGDTDNNNLSNCACVCISNPENCHLNVAHNGDFKNGELAPRSSFTLIR